MKCTIYICEARPTWEGTYSTIDGSQSVDVCYCDSHAWSQINSVPDTLSLRLTPISQRSKS